MPIGFVNTTDHINLEQEPYLDRASSTPLLQDL